MRVAGLLSIVACLLSVAGGAEWRWQGKTAVVTGASSGIGSVIAVSLANMGMTVIGLARRDDKIRELSRVTRGTLLGYRCDLTKEEDIVKAFQWIEGKVGGVDVLINNAGVYYQGGFINGSTDQWRRTLDVNILGMAIASREALNSMRRRGDDGHIVNINSANGHRVHQYYLTAMQSPSKFAVTGFTEELRVELRQIGSNIKVTSISPGAVKTFPDPNGSSYPHLLGCDIAEAVLYVLGTRPGVQVHELMIQATGSSVCPSF